jgi:hypothetical protein
MRSGKIMKSAILMFSLFATFSLLNAQEHTRGVGNYPGDKHHRTDFWMIWRAISNLSLSPA